MLEVYRTVLQQCNVVNLHMLTTVVTVKQFQRKQLKQGAKCTHKIHKIAILSDTTRARHDALTYIMTHYTKLFKS